LPPASRWSSPRKDSPSPSSPSKFGRSPESPPTAAASARAPTTCASYAANSSSSTRVHPPLPRTRGQHAHHHRPADTPREGHHAAPRRDPHARTRPTTQNLDQHRPRLRNHPPQHATPAQRPRHRDQGYGRIDNDLSIASRNPLGDQALARV
jgi:hypothetical protein